MIARAGFLRTTALLALASLAARTGPAAAQAVTVRRVGGIVRGIVRDSATGEGIGYAMITVAGTDLRVFTAETGRFALEGLSEGEQQLRALQIGYAARDVAVHVVDQPGAPDLLTIVLARRPYRLPDIVVTSGSSCETGAVEAGTDLLAEVFANAERLAVLERNYPFRSMFVHSRSILDWGEVQRMSRRDTLVTRSDLRDPYRAKHVVRNKGWSARDTWVAYFTVADLATKEFRKNHCVWYAGPDTTKGMALARFDFVPIKKAKWPDWAGSLYIDTATSVLRWSEAHLVNFKPQNTWNTLMSIRCEIAYRELAPTLIHEDRAGCITLQSDSAAALVGDAWRLVDLTFVRRRPGDSLP